MSDQQPVKVFVSHHSSKVAVALQIEALLARRGVRCWIAPRDVPLGGQFDTAVHNAIEDSAAVLLLFCSSSDKSRHVKRELILGDSAGRPIIPLRLEAIDPGELAYHLADSQWIDWIDRREAVIDRVAAQARLYANAPAELAGDVTMPGAVAADEPAGGGMRNWVFAGLGAVIALLALMLVMTRFGDDNAASTDAGNTDAGSTDAAMAEVEAAAGEPSISGAAAGAADPQVAIGDTAMQNTPPPAQASPASSRTAAPTTLAEPSPTLAPIAPIAAGPLQRVVQACAGAASDTEYLICSNPDLGTRARAMSALLGEVRSGFEAAGEGLRQFNIGQRQWMNGVKASCHSAACVEASQLERIEALRAISASLD